MSRLKNMNKKAVEILDKRFKELLVQGNWPEVEYKRVENGMVSYSMMAYGERRSQFCKAVHDKVVNAGYEFGLWENARNKGYIGAVTTSTEGLTIEEVNNSDRFRTMFD